MTTSKFELSRNSYGRLTLTQGDGEGLVFDNVAPVRAFPVQAPLDGIAIVCSDGKEVGWIDRLEDLSPASRALVQEELGGREFMPEISRIDGVSSYATPCTWTVQTDRGETAFVLRGEEDIRRIGNDTLLVSDTHGIHFLIRDAINLDKHSKKILDRFL
ncbi:DUF1854 domain-containing protein [Oxalobacteraceae bacterium]|nr:DUF1854 domain-containing protein [Oxalobacteraceae bacterium]